MSRIILPLALGSIFGIAATSIVLFAPVGSGNRVEGSSGTLPRIGPDDAAVQVIEPATLESMIDRAAAEPSSAQRAESLQALLLRLAEIDPHRALLKALATDADQDTLSALFRLVAETDRESALAALSRIAQPAARRAVSLALLDVLGSDRDGIALVAAALPAPDRMNFTFDAIATRAATDPAGAITLALALDDLPAQSEAIKRVARVLAGQDARAALRHAAAFGSYVLSDTYKAAVLEEWASFDVDGFLTFVQSAASAEIPSRTRAFEIVAAGDARRLLALIDDVPQAVRSTAERAAVETLVRSDAASALAYIRSLPAGQSRESLLTSAARSFALHDLDGALAWLGALQPPEASATTGVLQVLAEADPVRGAEALVSRLEGAGSIAARLDIGLVISSFTPGPREALSLVADRLSAVNDPLVRDAFDRFIEQWSQNDVDAAHDWALANADRLTSNSLAYLARNLSAQRPDLAKQAVDRISPDMQNAWIRAVAGELARKDLDDVLQWIARYRGQPVYDAALETALQTLSLPLGNRAVNPESVAQFLDRQSPRVRAGALAVVANFWAEQDPRAAARWAERIELGEADEGSRHAALFNIATQWAARDPDAARDWVLELPPGESRDQVLGALIRSTAVDGLVDARAIDAFSTDDARQRELASTMLSLGRSDPALGRALIDRYIDDPEQRALAEQQLIQGPSSPFGSGRSIMIRN